MLQNRYPKEITEEEEKAGFSLVELPSYLESEGSTKEIKRAVIKELTSSQSVLKVYDPSGEVAYLHGIHFNENSAKSSFKPIQSPVFTLESACKLTALPKPIIDRLYGE